MTVVVTGVLTGHLVEGLVVSQGRGPMVVWHIEGLGPGGWVAEVAGTPTTAACSAADGGQPDGVQVGRGQKCLVDACGQRCPVVMTGDGVVVDHITHVGLRPPDGAPLLNGRQVVRRIVMVASAAAKMVFGSGLQV